jgi:hypothetical protein
VVNQTNVRLAAAANNRFLMPHLPEKWPCIKTASWALDIDAMAVKIHPSDSTPSSFDLQAYGACSLSPVTRVRSDRKLTAREGNPLDCSFATDELRHATCVFSICRAAWPERLLKWSASR